MDKLGRTVRTAQYQDQQDEEIISKSRFTILGKPDSIVSPNGFVTMHKYNFLGQMTQKSDPDEGTSKYAYDKAGRLRFMVDSVGLVANPNKVLYWKYDIFGRVKEKGYLTTVNWTDGVLTTNINNQSYPTTPITWRKQYFYDFAGRLTNVYTNNDDLNDIEVYESFTYDKLGNILNKGLKIADYDANTYTTTYSYDLLGRAVQTSYPSTSAVNVTYTYDQANRVKQIGQLDTAAFASYTYNAKGEMLTETLNPNGIPQVRTYSYQKNGLLSGIANTLFTETLKDSSGVNNNEKFYHGLYASVQTVYGSMSPTSPQYIYKLKYDKYGRLIVADNNNYNQWDVGVIKQTKYDLNGNFDSLQRGVTVAKKYALYSNKNQVQNVDGSGNDYSYDQTGNMTSAPGLTLSYDPFTQMTMKVVKGTRKVYFQYDGLKERVLKVDSNGTVTKTAYLRSMADYPVVHKVSNGDERIYVHGPTGLAAVRMNGTWYYIHKDHLNSTKLVPFQINKLVLFTKI